MTKLETLICDAQVEFDTAVAADVDYADMLADDLAFYKQFAALLAAGFETEALTLAQDQDSEPRDRACWAAKDDGYYANKTNLPLFW